jgi:hypothetical protein
LQVISEGHLSEGHFFSQVPALPLIAMHPPPPVPPLSPTAAARALRADQEREGRGGEPPQGWIPFSFRPNPVVHGSSSSPTLGPHARGERGLRSRFVYVFVRETEPGLGRKGKRESARARERASEREQERARESMLNRKHLSPAVPLAFPPASFTRSCSLWLSHTLSADLDYTIGGGQAKSREQKTPACDASFDTTGSGLDYRP